MQNQQKITNIDILNDDVQYNFILEFNNFLNNFTINGIHIYTNISSVMTIYLEHMNQFSSKLFTEFLEDPEDLKMQVEEFLSDKKEELITLNFISNFQYSSIRNIETVNLNKIVRVKGIITNISSKFIKPIKLFVLCKACLNTQFCFQIPRNCTSQCGTDPFTVIPEKSIKVDAQTMKIQELHGDMPVGETPRHLKIHLENNLIDKQVPGQIIEITGIYKINGLKAIGIKKTLTERNFTDTEISSFYKLKDEKVKIKSKEMNFYERFVESLAPEISGMNDVKKTLVLQLFGGSGKEKIIKTRGFINVLLLGDPGIAKSQLLKRVKQISPISVYTSGKGASAAGLTATVLKNSANQFFLEGGALVLADKGICCIDEFDKMSEQDRVSIHEAMEQGTISIAKAGITTCLNTRTSILAAANPKFGRYDKFKDFEENVELETTILSRFDALFILKDEIKKERDLRMAEHILSVHKKKINLENLLSDELMKRYILYSKNIKPKLTDGAKEMLRNFYLEMRSFKSKIPITVRQLEAIIRFTEARARVDLRESANESDVEDAILIFKNSTLKAVNDGMFLEGMKREDFLEDLEIKINKILEFLPKNSFRNVESLIAEMGDREATMKALNYLKKKQIVELKHEGNTVFRIN